MSNQTFGSLTTYACGICGGFRSSDHAEFAVHMSVHAEPQEFVTREMLEDQLAAANAALAERVHLLRAALAGVTTQNGVVGLCWCPLDRPVMAGHTFACGQAKAALAPAEQPDAELDDEIRMPMAPGIPGVGIVMSSGPRPELVIEDEYRQPCPNGCLGQWGEGCEGQPVPAYCNVNGCDMESPGMAYKPECAETRGIVGEAQIGDEA